MLEPLRLGHVGGCFRLRDCPFKEVARWKGRVRCKARRGRSAVGYLRWIFGLVRRGLKVRGGEWLINDEARTPGEDEGWARKPCPKIPGSVKRHPIAVGWCKTSLRRYKDPGRKCLLEGTWGHWD